MDAKTALTRLETAGTAQNRKVYARHGVEEPMFGVSFAALGKLKKEIKQDTALAKALWASGNHDARVLATMVADPAELGAGDIARWAQALDNYVLTDAFSKCVAQARGALEWARKWIDARDEWTSTAGWNVLAMLAGDERLCESELLGLLERIRDKIHASPNRTRYAMNQALISIGSYRAGLRTRALEVAKAIGVVEVDHGETGCKTPDAEAYIAKVVGYQAGRAAKKKVANKKTAKKKVARRT